MIKANALTLRQNLGNILRQLKKTGKPILIEKNREAAAVLITLDDYQKRFVDIEADEHRQNLIATIKAAQIKLKAGQTTQSLIDDLRS